MKLLHSARTDVGRSRDHNEDSYGVGADEQIERLGTLLVICDGMGGHAAGEVASRLAVDTILADFYADSAEEREVVLEQAFDHANEQVYARGRGSMGTTGVAALLHHDALHAANVGDSRAYLVRGGEIRQVTRDHSFVSDQVAAGLITPEQARSSQYKNVITRAIGYQPEVSTDMFRLPLQIGDIVLLCSDGLHGLVTDEELGAIASEHVPDEAVDLLIDLANERGGSDNITVALARVEALDWDAQPVTAEDLAADHQRATTELTAPEDEVIVVPPATPAPAPTQAPAHAPIERKLTLLGGLLATLLLTLLLLATLFVLNMPAQGTTTQPTALPTVGLSASPAPTIGPAATPRP